ncbi:hypothetical protein [Haladaptatus halobius]|uniref:hypothetical protein n=1 Tax=Haladaptatus halobius TaxID=2884875 RepID=UPI001D09A74B|nr:hypothetical protein [Haladaptatus halobius]
MSDDTQSARELLEESLQEEANVEQLFDELLEKRENGGTVGRDLGGLIGCGLGMLLGRKFGESVGVRVESRFGRGEREASDDTSREQLIRQRIQDAFELSKEEANQILADAPIGRTEPREESGEDGGEGKDTEQESDSEEDPDEAGTETEDAETPEEEDESNKEEMEAEDDSEAEQSLDLDDLSDKDLQTLANDLLDELKQRKTAQ